MLPVTAQAAGITVTEAIPCRYDDVIESFSQGLAWVKLDGKYGCIDKTGQMVVPCRYDYASPFSESLAAVRVGDGETGKWGYLAMEEAPVAPSAYASTQTVLVALDTIVLKDDAGGAYTYYKLRDLGAALDFTVGRSAETGIYIQTD